MIANLSAPIPYSSDPAATLKIDALYCVYLEPVSMSIAKRWYFEELQTGQPFIAWLVGALRKRLIGENIVLLCHSTAEQRVMSSLAGKDVETTVTARFQQLAALAELTSNNGTKDIVLLPPGVCFAPHDLLKRVYNHHVTLGNSVTVVRGLPKGVGPYVLDRSFFALMSDLKWSGMPADPGALAEFLTSYQECDPQGRPLPICAQPFDASKEYGIGHSDLPKAISFEVVRTSMGIPSGMDLARAVINEVKGLESDSMGLEALRMWRRIEQEEGQRRRGQLLRSVLPVSPQLRKNSSLVRILFVSNPSAFSGAEQSLCELIAKLNTNKFELFALVGAEGHFTNLLRSLGVSVICPGGDFAAESPENVLYTMSVFKNVQPDIAHFNAPRGVSPMIAALLCDVPVVQHIRNGALDPYSESFKFATEFIVVSEFLRNGVLSQGVMQERIRLIYDEVDIDYFRPEMFDTQSERQLLNIPVDAKVVVHIARAADNKRHDIMIQAGMLVKEREPSFHLVLKCDVYGDSEYWDNIFQRIRHSDIRDSVTWIPFVPDIRTVLAVADAVVLCSDAEGLGRCVVEAMAMERPVVVTDTGGSHEIVEDGNTGFIVPGGDARVLAERIVHLLSDEETRRRVGAAARTYVQQNLSSQASAAKVMELYMSIYQQRRGYEQYV
jgi:glycosyltransferase involved in cell wall biosynthesis